MSTPSDNNNIVDLQQRQANQLASQDRVGDLLKIVRGTALKRVQGLVATLFENIDDALFDLAERAENNSIQTQYFDGMREVRKKRQLVERLFQEQLSKVFNEFAAGKMQPTRADNIAGGNGDLSLVDDKELEESLAIASTVAKAENRLARPLYAVNQRLSVMLGGAKVEDATNPIAPAPLCQAFRFSMREMELNLQTQLIIYKLFDRYVMSGLDALYEEVNELLIQAGVLPQIRHTVAGMGNRPNRPMPPPSGAPPPHMQQDGAQNPDQNYGSYGQGYGQQYDQAAAQLQAEIYNTVRNLLASRRPSGEGQDYSGAHQSGGMPGTGGMPGQMPPVLAPTELLSALTLLQNQAMMAQSHASTAADAAQTVQQIKQELLDQATKFHGSEKAHVAGADEDTIDLVGMLFEFILQDRNLPPQMQALLGRLQIPFLKVAILDKHLFAQKAHPARQLLDAMAQACIGWSEESDRDHRLYDKVKSTVEALLKDFDDDLTVFERTRNDFENFLEGNKKRADLAEQRAAEATRGREKLHAARRTAAKEILKRVDGRELPDIVHSVLTRPWANYLVLTLLRQGEESNEWRHALRFADEFAWSAEPKNTDADRTRLKGLLPALEKGLRHGLATVAYHENDVKQLMVELNAFYRNLLHGDTVKTPSGKAANEEHAGFEIVGKAVATATAVESPIEEIVMGAEEESPDNAYADDDECLAQAKGMKVGTWVEFTDATTGNKERAKLSWISPISSKYLFVNRKGLKVSDKTVFALAAEIRRGQAVVLEEVPLFDRALDAIVERLKAAHAPTAEPDPA
ncbi:MAG: DUF1631 domain-containing protein [Rudaea sp.]